MDKKAVLTELLRTKETSTFLGGESPTTVITGSKYIPLLSGAVQGDCTVDYAVDAALLSEIRGVLLIGPEGSGKSTALQKLAVDWAQGERLQNFSFVFHFNLRDFNSLGGERSLKALLQSSHPSLTAGSVAVVAKRPEEVLFVFDSLDQYRHSLDPSVHALCSDPNQEAAVSCLVASLLHGSLLRGSAFVVATRPTSNLKYLNGTHVEVLGFSKLQREVYFTNCFTDANATKPLLHMERTLGFYNICSSPRFCWTVCSIYSLLLDSGAKLPETLSQLFVDILVHLMETLCLNEASVRALVSPLGRMASLCLLDHSNIAQESIKSFGCQQLLTAVDAFLVVDGDPESDKCTFSFRSQLMQEFILALAFFLRESPGEGVEHFLTKHKGRATFLDFFLSGLSEEVQRRPLETLLGKANPDQIEDFRRWFKSSSAETWRGYEKDKHYRCFHLLHQAQNEALTKEIITPSARLEYHTDLSLQDCVALNYVAMSFNKIPSLSLCGTNILPEMAKFLTPTMSVSHSLNFSHCTFSTGAIPHLASALRNGVVSDLCLYNSHCGDEMLNVLATSLQNSKLQKLSLHGCDLTGGCCDDLVPLLTSQLCTLVINFNQIGDDGFIKLCKALNCPHNRLQELDMHNCNLTAASMEAFAEALCSGQSHLRKVNLRANKIGDDGVRALSKSLQNSFCKLHSLELYDTELTGACCSHLKEALESEHFSLLELDLSVNELGQEGALLLCQGLNRPGCPIEKLYLNRCELTPPVFKELASLLKVGTLKSLSVGVNDVGDKGAKYLWEAVAHPNCLLEELDVEMTGLTDACVEDLCAALRASKTLKRLEMKNNSLTDVSVPAIIRAFQDSANMQELNLRYNDFSEEVLHLLDEAKIRY
ncbi:NACHT, LRR and PYD domains-containing protein 3 [Oryzias melastigma]|uniref:Si:ch73-233m11.2 n=1 Tax=Oryzias melastigma TaxID=30732 RepID=A0A3B3DDB8_ORYME|nr:NACHT, LRR and PYD domains-containing protein 3 [Oryzias melastigma]